MATAPEYTSPATEDNIGKATEEDIRVASDGLGPDELDHLFANLCIPQHLISHAKKSANTDDTVLQARAVLYKWRKITGNDFTREILFDERDKILEKKKGKSVKGTKGEEFLKECQDQLRQKYLSEMKVQLAPWDPSHLQEMDAICVDLELEENEDRRLKRNEDLLELKINEGLRANRILVQGDTGSGKSTLLDNIAYKWALQLHSAKSSDHALSQYDLVFAIRIHEIIDKNDSIETIIFDQILEEDGQNVCQDSLKSYLQSNAERCLFLIDGIDEDSSKGILNSTTTYMSRLLYKRLYKNSCVIASTRPDILESMRCNLKPFTKVNLRGFSDGNIEGYIKKYFAAKNVDYSELLQRLRDEPHVWDLAGTPLLLLFFCLLWEDPNQAEKSLPNTRTKLYQETISSLWVRFDCNLSGESPLTMIDFLENLGKVTLEGILDKTKEKVLFNNSDFDEATLSLALRVGIISRKKTRSRLHMNTVKFMHTSIQDFCSAMYVAKLFLTNPEKCKQYIEKMHLYEIILYVPWFNRISQVQSFCSGIKPETAYFITHELIAALDTHDQALQGILPKNPELEFLSVESMSIGLKRDIKLFGDIYRDSLDTKVPTMTFLFVLIFEAQLSYEECNKLVCIILNSGRLVHLNWKLGQTEKHVQYQLDLLKSINDTNNGLMFSALYSIQLLDAIRFPEFYPLIVSMLKYTKQLHFLHLRFQFDLKINQVSNLAEMYDALSDLEHLEFLFLQRDMCDANDLYCVDISKSLHKVCQLQRLELCFSFTSAPPCYLFDLNMSHQAQDMYSLMEAISKLHKLSRLRLIDIVIGRAVKCLKPIIPQLNCFTLLAPLGPCLNVWDVHTLAYFLQDAKKLNKLVLSGYTVRIAICTVADQLEYMVNLKELCIYCADLRSPEILILVSGITSLPTLSTLDLRYNPKIGMDGRDALESAQTSSISQNGNLT